MSKKKIKALAWLMFACAVALSLIGMIMRGMIPANQTDSAALINEMRIFEIVFIQIALYIGSAIVWARRKETVPLHHRILSDRTLSENIMSTRKKICGLCITEADNCVDIHLVTSFTEEPKKTPICRECRIHKGFFYVYDGILRWSKVIDRLGDVG